MCDDAEGVPLFDIEYFGHTAHLAQSPQFYKQIMVGVFERVFTTGNVYRAEKHRRHDISMNKQVLDSKWDLLNRIEMYEDGE